MIHKGKKRSHPFQGTCPIAYDGTKTVYSFYTSTKTQKIDSCEVEVNLAHPLFKRTEVIRSQVFFQVYPPEKPIQPQIQGR
ncbi:hypothetical protein [Merismopedia glauca]|uniref:Uncharacterized protein n=1 Tax=Merismopedia glauca CCAP 1448/3 TaxID=1296344 RepID=A0A2T1C156_9CYAN|nr:hypothetical protein [Merismopedia glauca]PSB01897.1 hypothetical protein C7B64_15895 [Merismopedia glauca CCAP 1448/3]